MCGKTPGKGHSDDTQHAVLTKWHMRYIENAYNELETGIIKRRIAQLGLKIHNKVLLDVGCGPGNFLIAALKEGPKQIVGIDPDEHFLAASHNELKRQSSKNFTLLKGTAAELPFADESFDIVTCFLVLAHVLDDRNTMIELGRVLKTEGILVVSGHDKGFPLRYLKRLRLKPFMMYPASLIYALTGRKIIRNTLQNYKKVCEHLAGCGFIVEQVTIPRKSLGLAATYQIKAAKFLNK